MDWSNWKYTARDLPIVFLVVLLAIPEVKFYHVKPIEILGLVSLLANVRRLSRLELHFSLFFLGALIFTLIQNIWLPFVEQKHSFPKTPYFISLVRFIEYLSCIGIVAFVRNQILSVLSIDYFVRRLLLFCTIVNIAIVCIYLLDYFNLSDSGLTYICGGRFRLRGFFFEGGPLGMYNSFLLILTLHFIDGKEKYYYALIFVVMIFLSLSKAGAVAFLVYMGCRTTVKLYKAYLSNIYKILIAAILAIPLIYSIYALFAVYTDSLFNYSLLIEIANENPDHFWNNGGRVPGFYIVKEMMVHHPVFGVGIGNYQLLRDVEIYRAGFPSTSLWDYHGFGGVVDIVIQNGFFGLWLFLSILYHNIKHNRFVIIGLFLIPFCFGTTLHFCYPWMILAIYNTPQN